MQFLKKFKTTFRKDMFCCSIPLKQSQIQGHKMQEINVSQSFLCELCMSCRSLTVPCSVLKFWRRMSRSRSRSDAYFIALGLVKQNESCCRVFSDSQDGVILMIECDFTINDCFNDPAC